jgi:hypothetical protein
MREPWEQRLDEPDIAYRQFVWWRDQTPRPPPSDPGLARDFDWSSRAAAWEAVQSIPSDRIARLGFALDATIEVVALEMHKLRAMSRTDRAMVASPKEIAAIELRAFQILKLMQEREGSGNVESVETAGELVSELTEEEQRVMLRLLEKRGV